MKDKIRRTIYLVLAFLFLAIAGIGVIIPILPTTPFLLLASFFFTRGWERFNKWFLSSKLYKNHLEDFVKSREMTLKNKLRILIPVTAMLLISIYLVKNIHGRLAIGCVIACKYYYFIFRIRTSCKQDERGGEKKTAETNIDM